MFIHSQRNYAAITSPVVGFNSSHFPPLSSIAALADFVKACAWTVISFAVKSAFPTTIFWRLSFDLVMLLDSKRESKLQVSPLLTPFNSSNLITLYTVFVCPGPVGLPTNFGNLLYKGCCPPSNPGLDGLPLLDFCPRIPNPQVAPCPALIPRPFLFLRCRDPGAGFRLVKVNSTFSTSLMESP